MVVRSLLLLVLFATCSAAAETSTAIYKGRTVVSVIDEFRAQDWLFAYSTNLVNESLLVTVEPQATTPPEIVGEILAPHGLIVRAEAGFYLIVRAETPLVTAGILLIVVRDRGQSAPLGEAEFHATPELVSGRRLAPGVTQFSDILAGTYLITTEVTGFELAEREVTVLAGETAVLQVNMQPERPVIELITVSASRYEIFGGKFAQALN